MDVLIPVLNVLYVPLDWVLGWSARLPAAWAVGVVGVISGAAVMVFQKYASRQSLLKKCKDDLRLLKLRIRAARQADDREAVARLSGLVRRISGTYMGGALKPALWTVPIIGVVALWCGSRLGFHPIRPGDVFKVTAHFEDRAAGFAHLVPVDGLVPQGPAIAAVGSPQAAQASWEVRAAAEGLLALRVRYADRTHDVAIPVAARGGRPPEPVTVFADATPGQDRLQAVELGLRPSVRCRLVPFLPEAGWNPDLQWAGLYLWGALVCAVALRLALKIQ
jgi:uncharacterized membrane protein (DUF106 family)